MAYTTATLNCVAQGQGDSPSIYVYLSPDARATVEGASFFTDGVAKGMKLGDVVIVIYTTGYLATVHAVSVVTASTGATTINAAVLA
jgi:predicted amidophosphoribosyltransferase